MGSLIYVILGGVVVFFAFKMSVAVGLIAVLAVMAILVYSLYPKYTIGRANALFNNGETETAINKYRKVIKMGRADINTRIAFANLLMRSDNASAALTEINKVLSVRLEQKVRYLAKQTRCMINYRLGNMDEAMEEINELFEDGYKTSNTYSIMGYFMLLTKAPLEETLAMCEEAYDYDNESRDIVDNLLSCYLKTGRLEKAKEISDHVIKLAPQFVEGFYHSVMLYEALGDHEKAKECAQKLKDCKRSVMTTIPEADVNKVIAKYEKY